MSGPSQYYIFTTVNVCVSANFRENREIFLHTKISCFTVLCWLICYVSYRLRDMTSALNPLIRIGNGYISFNTWFMHFIPSLIGNVRMINSSENLFKSNVSDKKNTFQAFSLLTWCIFLLSFFAHIGRCLWQGTEGIILSWCSQKSLHLFSTHTFFDIRKLRLTYRCIWRYRRIYTNMLRRSLRDTYTWFWGHFSSSSLSSFWYLSTPKRGRWCTW